MDLKLEQEWLRYRAIVHSGNTALEPKAERPVKGGFYAGVLVGSILTREAAGEQLEKVAEAVPKLR